MKKNPKPDLAALGLPQVCTSGPECAKVLGVEARTFWRWLDSDAELAEIVKVRHEFKDVRTGTRRLIIVDTRQLLQWQENRTRSYRSSRKSKAKAS